MENEDLGESVRIVTVEDNLKRVERTKTTENRENLLGDDETLRVTIEMGPLSVGRS